MALLDQLIQQKESIVVAHVNYQKRKSAWRDEKIVKDYCDLFDLPCFVLHPTYEGKQNFQAWARQVRYAFFEKIMDQEDIQELYVAHHMDDLIETYIFQKQRGMLCDHFGLAPISYRANYSIHRPLLHQEKSELEQYCISHRIPYGIDESNLTNHYTRNRIRHERIEKLSKKEKERIVEKINNENEKWKTKRERLKNQIESQGIVSFLDQEEGWLALDLYLSPFLQRHLSKAHLISLCTQLRSSCLIDLETHEIERWQEKVLVVPKKEYPSFVFATLAQLQAFKPLDLTHFQYAFSKTGKTMESLALSETDFPLTLRPATSQDAIELRWGRKKMKRFWIDRKIPKVWRKEWYVLENRHGSLVFVPGIGCDRRHFSIQPNAFMLQLTI